MYLFTFMTEYAFVCACMCAYVSVYFNLFKSYTTYSMYVCTYAYMHICMYACIYVCMYNSVWHKQTCTHKHLHERLNLDLNSLTIIINENPSQYYDHPFIHTYSICS